MVTPAGQNLTAAQMIDMCKQHTSHPMCLAAAVANLRVLEEDDMVGNSPRLGTVIDRGLDVTDRAITG